MNAINLRCPKYFFDKQIVVVLQTFFVVLTPSVLQIALDPVIKLTVVWLSVCFYNAFARKARIFHFSIEVRILYAWPYRPVMISTQRHSRTRSDTRIASIKLGKYTDSCDYLRGDQPGRIFNIFLFCNDPASLQLDSHHVHLDVPLLLVVREVI